jgi:hypothetical protein
MVPMKIQHNASSPNVKETGDKLSPVLLLPLTSYRRCRCYWRLIISGVMISMKIQDNSSSPNVKDTGDNFFVTGDKLSPVSLLLAINYRRCHGDDDNPGQCLSTGVRDTGNNLSPVTNTPALNTN